VVLIFHLFLVYLIMLSIPAHTLSNGRAVNNALEMMWKEAFMA
jgi:hypothetical protein